MINSRYLKSEISKHVKLPEENVEYTFIFPGQRYVTYTYCGLNEKGRLILYNVKQKTFSSMTPGWFNALCGKRRQLVSKRPVGGETTAPSTVPVVVKGKEETYEERSLRELRTLTPLQARAVLETIGYTAKELADDLEKILADETEQLYSAPYVGRAFSDLIRAQSIIRKAQKANNLGL